MFSRILVPTDFSPPSDAALEYARILAAKFGSTLRILHVIDDPSASSDFVGDGFAPSTEDIRIGLLAHARKRLGQLMNLVDRSRYHAHADAVLGTPGSRTPVDGQCRRTGRPHFAVSRPHRTSSGSSG